MLLMSNMNVFKIDWEKYQRISRPAHSGVVSIKGKNIYILPTSYGVLYLMLMIVMLVGAVNYNNNPVFLLTFLMLGIGINTLFQTWDNLRGLSLQFIQSAPVFCGQPASFQYRFIASSKQKHIGIAAYWSQSKTTFTDVGQNDVMIDVVCGTLQRGRLKPGKMTIITVFPLGLFKAWAYIDSTAETIVYPRPLTDKLARPQPHYEGSFEGDTGVGTDDFVGHRNYRSGDSPQHINWKLLAAEKGVLIKQFGGDRANRQAIDWNSYPDVPIEQKLSLMAGQILEFEKQHIFYSLKLPNVDVASGLGNRHEAHCLHLLATYGES